MISRLPAWVWLGGWVLAFIAGVVNAVGFLGIGHEAVSHLTGTATLSAVALTQGNLPMLLHFAGIAVAFFSGAILSGAIIPQSTLKLGRPYGVVLFLESALLFLAIPILSSGHLAGLYLAACACGLQNAMASSYSGAVIRTTHVSGMVTDIGIILGHWLRRLPCDRKRLGLYALLISGFVAGGVVGAILFARVSYQALLFPAALTGLAGLVYTALAKREDMK